MYKRQVLGGSFVLRPVDSARGTVSAADASTGDVEVDLSAVSYPDQVGSEVLAALRSAGAEGLMKGNVTDPDNSSKGGGEVAKARRRALADLEARGLARHRREPGTARGERWWAAEFAPGDDHE